MLDFLHLDELLWSVLGLVWLVGMPLSVRTIRKESPAERASYAAPLILGCMLIFSRAFASVLPGLSVQLVPAEFAIHMVSVALTGLGVGIAIWARVTLGKLWSGNITLKEGHRLIQIGPYALARHPIYTGFSCGIVGTALGIGTARALLGAAIAVASFIYKLGREERLLASQFGAEHAEYRARVKRLIPFVW